jgi:DNA-binding NtrC family response regulator
VTVNCGALPAGLIESELFGHERGAFTGAERAFGGRVEEGAGGTLFLDEVNSLPLDGQAKLLRFLESGELSRVGCARRVAVDVRIVSASNVSLLDDVAQGRMREDFFHRLNVLTIEVPPLRERLEDLPILVHQCLAEDPVATRLGVVAVAPHVLEQLASYRWPGNVRELRNVVRRALIFGSADGALVSAKLPTDGSLDTSALGQPLPENARGFPRFRAWMMERERQYLAELERHFPTPSERAAAAGLPARTLYRKLRGLRDGEPSRAFGADIGRRGRIDVSVA